MISIDTASALFNIGVAANMTERDLHNFKCYLMCVHKSSLQFNYIKCTYLEVDHTYSYKRAAYYNLRYRLILDILSSLTS